VRTYLGRPWRSFASVAFLSTEMSEVVRPEGWHNWNRPDREKTARYTEHGTTGAAASAAARVAWARTLGAAEAAALTSAGVARRDGRLGSRVAGSVVQRGGEGSASGGRTPFACAAPARFERDVEYARPGGESLKLDVCTPPGRGPFPAALLVHGGAGSAAIGRRPRPGSSGRSRRPAWPGSR